MKNLPNSKVHLIFTNVGCLSMKDIILKDKVYLSFVYGQADTHSHKSWVLQVPCFSVYVFVYLLKYSFLYLWFGMSPLSIGFVCPPHCTALRGAT